MEIQSLLRKHARLVKRREFSEERLANLSHRLQELLSDKKCEDVCVFAAGSFGRLEAGSVSDLDIFVISDGSSHSPLEEVRLLAAIADINDDLEFPPFASDMRFFKLYTRGELIDHTGQPLDDTENSFTARMLLLLESRPVAGAEPFKNIAGAVSDNYFRDNKGKRDFRPLFLLNDLLRFWRTLCLNYEGTRSDPEKSWRKKNLNLRFSRLATVFSTVVALLALRPKSSEEFLPLVTLTPFERLALAIDKGEIGVDGGRFNSFLDDYEWFLQLKDEKGAESTLSDVKIKQDARHRAESIASFFQDVLSSDPLKGNSRYLTL